MTTKWEKVYVFISSTFNDMHGERDYLVKQVFPQLQEWCERRKLRLVDIDLRWGVTEQDALYNKNAMKVCLDRIDECRPFFLCFLGQRRGWVPKEDEISQETFELFPELRSFAGKTSITEIEILHALINPLHQGKPRDPGKPDEYYERVKYAFFYLRDPSYLDKLPSSPPLLRQTYTNEGVEDPRERQIHEQELKNWREVKIKKESNRPVHSYEARWDSSAVTPELSLPLQCPSAEPINIERWRQQWIKTGIVLSSSNIEDNPPKAEKAKNFNKQLCTGRLTDFKSDGLPLSQVIIKDLQEAIANRYPDHIEVVDQPDLQKEIDQQEQFLFVSSIGFIERGDDFGELDEYVENDSKKLYVLTAPSGMGKSMLLANWVDRYRTRIENMKEESIHFRFIGASDRSTRVYSLLRFLLLEIKEIAHKFDKDIPEDPEELRKVWPELLDALSKRGKTIIVIDALNQLESGLSDLNWLPWQLPSNIKLIVSFKRGEQATEELYQRFSNSGQVMLSEVRPFEDLDDRRKLVQAYLSQYLKDIDKQHLETLIKSKGASNPLYLKVVLSELRVFGAFAGLEEKIQKDFGETPVSAFKGVLKRLERDPAYSPIHPGQAVPLLFGLMAHARHGLSADELTSLFIQALKLEDTEKQREIAADTVYQFLREVRPFLARREGRYDFYFESFKNAAEECYVANSPEEEFPKRLSKDWHRMLAEYFKRKSDPTGDGMWKGNYSHGLSELPYHQMRGEMWEKLKLTLCDLRFVEEKCAFQMTFDLVFDYSVVLESNHTPVECQQTVKPFFGFVRSRSHVLAGCPSMTIQEAFNFADPGSVADQAIDILRGPDYSSRVWIRRLNRSTTIEPCKQTLTGHADGIDAVALTPDGGRILSASRDGEIKVWDLNVGRCLQTLKGHQDEVNCVVVSPDGFRVATGSKDRSVRVWDLSIGTCTLILEGHTGPVNALAVTPDGVRIVSCGDGEIKAWDISSGACLYTVKSHWIKTVVVTPDGRWILTGSDDHTVRIWDLATGRYLRTLAKHESGVNVLALKPDGKSVLAGSWDKQIKMWDLQTGTCLIQLEGHRGLVFALAITTDGRKLVSGGWDQTIRVWDLDTGSCLEVLRGHTSTVMSLQIVPGGGVAVSGSLDHTVKIWDLTITPSEQNQNLVDRHKNVVRAVMMMTNGQNAVTGSDDHTVKVWEIATGRCLRTFEEHKFQVHGILVSPDERRLVTLAGGPYEGHNSEIKLWDIETGRCIWTIPGYKMELTKIIMTANGEKLLVILSGNSSFGGSNALRIYDLDNPLTFETFNLCRYNRPDVELSPDGRIAVILGDNGEIQVLDIYRKLGVRTLHTGEEYGPQELRLTPDGAWIVAWNLYDTLWVWDMASGNLLRRLDWEDRQVEEVELLPLGRQALTWSRRGTWTIWDLQSGACVQANACQSSGIYCPRIIRKIRKILCETRVLTVNDYWLEVWDMTSDVRPLTYFVEGGIAGLDISVDGTQIMLGSKGGDVHFLRLENVKAQPAAVTVWRWPSSRLLHLFRLTAVGDMAFGCPLCRTWSEIPASSLGKEIPCPHCGKPVRLNPFTISADWRSVAKARGMKDIPGETEMSAKSKQLAPIQKSEKSTENKTGKIEGNVKKPWWKFW